MKIRTSAGSTLNAVAEQCEDNRKGPTRRSYLALSALVFTLAATGVQGAVAVPTADAQTAGWWHGNFPVTQAYGCTSFGGEPIDHRHRCTPSKPRWHAGIDIGIGCGTPLYAARTGTVVSVGGPEHYYGPYYPRIRLADGHDVILAHVQRTVVHAGQHVNAGQLLAYAGTLGNSTGCHLHLEIRTKGGNYGSDANPGPYLR